MGLGSGGGLGGGDWGNGRRRKGGGRGTGGEGDGGGSGNGEQGGGRRGEGGGRGGGGLKNLGDTEMRHRVASRERTVPGCRRLPQEMGRARVPPCPTVLRRRVHTAETQLCTTGTRHSGADGVARVAYPAAWLPPALGGQE